MTRMRSLEVDQRDVNTFKDGRERGMGFCCSYEYYQSCPMFFTRERSEIDLVGQYKGSTLFIMANGPSVAKLDLDLLRKPGVMVYGMNNGPKTFRPNFWSCVDNPERFIKSVWLDPKIQKFIPFEHFEKKIWDNEKWQEMNIKVGDCPNVIGFFRNEKFVAERFLRENTFNWGCHKKHGGKRTVLLPILRIAFLLGFRKIYLLGVDFKMSGEYAYHFDEQRHDGAVRGNQSTYDRLINDYLPKLKPIFDQEGFNIYNCNPESGLKIFPFVDFKDAIADATTPLGDIENERTWGMYCKPEEKGKWVKPPDDTQKEHLKNTRTGIMKGLEPGAMPPVGIKPKNKKNKAAKAEPQKPKVTVPLQPKNDLPSEVKIVPQNIAEKPVPPIQVPRPNREQVDISKIGSVRSGKLPAELDFSITPDLKPKTDGTPNPEDKMMVPLMTRVPHMKKIADPSENKNSRPKVIPPPPPPPPVQSAPPAQKQEQRTIDRVAISKSLRKPTVRGIKLEDDGK